MKKILILTVAMLFVASLAFGWTVVGSKHDMRGYITGELSSQVCVYCHTPHQATGANKQDPLWNHSFGPDSGTYGVYGSDTLNAVPGEVNNPATPGAASTSKLCMTCHDGLVAVNALYKAPKDNSNVGTLISVTGAANLGTDLTDDHPVNFTYDGALATSDGGLKTPNSSSNVTATAGEIPLYASKVQCASCHNVHNNTNAPFLRVDNAASALCVKCHNK
ncbi:MAG: doubled CXXCH domain-containing protein [Nitrospirae bacterium]|nr:MAG: doubled CXXCH domain-containing protein [Nitrospirota bacterium]